MDCINELLDSQAFPKVERLYPVIGYCADIACYFNCLEIVKTKLMSRCYAEVSIGWVFRCCFNAAKSLTSAGVFCGIKVKLVEMLLTEY